MKKAIFLLCISIAPACTAMDRENQSITLPSAEVLSKKLCGAGFDDFVKKTNICTMLSARSLYPRGAARCIEQAVRTLYCVPSNKQLPAEEKKIAVALINILLADHPQAIVQLKTSTFRDIRYLYTRDSLRSSFAQLDITDSKN